MIRGVKKCKKCGLEKTVDKFESIMDFMCIECREKKER